MSTKQSLKGTAPFVATGASEFPFVPAKENSDWFLNNRSLSEKFEEQVTRSLVTISYQIIGWHFFVAENILRRCFRGFRLL